MLKISRQLFHRVLREYPESAKRLRAAMANELRSFVRELEESNLRRAEILNLTLGRREAPSRRMTKASAVTTLRDACCASSSA